MGRRTLGTTLVAGMSRVPSPATGMTIFFTSEAAGFCMRLLHRLPFHFGHLEPGMGGEEMPDHGLEGFSVRRDGGRVGDLDEHAGVGDLAGIAAVAADNA